MSINNEQNRNPQYEFLIEMKLKTLKRNAWNTTILWLIYY